MSSKRKFTHDLTQREDAADVRSDYHGAVGAGIEGRLIRRQGEWSDGAKREQQEDLGGVRVAQSLHEIVEEVKRRNTSEGG
jgi:hypothetical protein